MRCKAKSALLFSIEEREVLLKKFYSNQSGFSSVLEMETKVKISERYLDLDSAEEQPAKKAKQTDEKTPIDVLIRNYELYLSNAISGKGYEESTVTAKLRSLNRMISKNCIYYLEELLGKEDVMTILTKIEGMNIADGSRYDYALSVKEFLNFCHQEDDLSSELIEAIRKALIRWDNVRQTYQKGLIKDRSKKKKKQIMERELGLFPTVSDVSLCELYYRKKVPVISKSNFNKANMNKFFIWLAFYFSKTNAVRPSSIGNMKECEFKSFLKREELKIVCVEGKCYFKKCYLENLIHNIKF